MKRANIARPVVFMQSVVLSSQAIKYGVDPAHFMQQRWQDHKGTCFRGTPCIYPLTVLYPEFK